MTSIFTYTDYRHYIRDAIAEKQANNEHFSLRSAALHIGISSGSLTRVLNGTRHAGHSLCTKLVSFLGLRKREAAYFLLLVKFESVKDEYVRRSYYQEIMQLRSGRSTPVPKEQHRFFAQWYHVALFELLKIRKGPPDHERLGAMLSPPVSALRIRKACTLLEQLGYIRYNEDGSVVTTCPFLSTGDTWESAAIHDFQVSMSALAAKALDTVPKLQRDFSTMTVALDAESVEKIRAIIKNARTEIAAVEEQCLYPDRVYHSNFQCFPLTIPPNDGSAT